MRHIAYIFVIFTLTVNSVNADSLNLHFSNHSGRFIYSTQMFGGQYGPIDLETGLYFNEDDDVMAHLGLMVRNDTLDNPLVISVGARLYYANVGNTPPQTEADVGALAIGGEILFIPDNLGGLGFGIYYFGAPSVVSFLDADGFTEYGAKVDFAITQQASIYIGYQKIKTELDTGVNLEIDSSTYFGISLRF